MGNVEAVIDCFAMCRGTKMVAARMQKYEVGTVGDVEALTKYFGESYNPVDPGRVLRVVRDFMLLFDAAMLKIQVGLVPPPIYHAMSRPEEPDCTAGPCTAAYCIQLCSPPVCFEASGSDLRQ